ncbi:MAG: GNAT family N-acetyltransferase [Anaerolineales bacterium]
MSAPRPHEKAKPGLEVRALDEGDRIWTEKLWQERWGGPELVVHDEIFALRDLQAMIVWRGRVRAGLATYRVYAPVCEILSLDSLQPNQGIGTALLVAVAEQARACHCNSLRVTTTNGNLSSLRFYQRRGFVLRGLSPGAVNRARQKKPQIPLVGSNGIALRDEIELEKSLGGP